MNTALKVGPFILMLATMLISWIYGHSELVTSGAQLSPAALTQSAPAASDELALKTRGAWMCPSMDCSFRRWSSGDVFRSAAHQNCPFCGMPLQQVAPDAASN